MRPSPFLPKFVMVIDDDEFTCELLTTLLDDLGIENTVCENNGEAELSHFSKLEILPDLLICDLCMPGMDGIEFLRHIAEQGYRGNMILISGMDASVLKTAHSLADSYNVPLLGTLSKPVGIEQIQKLLEAGTKHRAPRPPPARHPSRTKTPRALPSWPEP